VASINLSAEGSGPSIQLRITKKEGIPIQLVKEGSPDAAIVAVKRVDELGFYNLSLTQLAGKVKLTTPKTLALVRHLNIQSDPEYFKQIIIGKIKFNRYSQKAINCIENKLSDINMDDIWKKYGPKRSKKR
jgi:hypothetical protein